MARRANLKGMMRAALLMHEIERAQRSLSLGPAGLFVRAALVVVFMYLVLIAYMMLGIAGPLFVSVLFLVAFFVPVLFRVARRSRPGQRMRARAPQIAGLHGAGQGRKLNGSLRSGESSTVGRSGQ